MVKWKFFTSKFGELSDESVEWATKILPGAKHFRNGVWDGKKGLFILSDPSSGSDDYDKPIKSKIYKDVLFFPPKKEIEDKQEFLNSLRRKGESIPVVLESDIVINIIPASMEPRNLVISLLDDEEEGEEYTTEYGKLAFELHEKLMNTEESVSPKEGMNLFVLGLSKSYDIQLDLFNWLKIMSYSDLEKLTYACMGYEIVDDDKKKDISQEEEVDGQQKDGKED